MTARRHAPRIEARTPQFALLSPTRRQPAPGSAGTVAVSVGDSVGDAVDDAVDDAAAPAAAAAAVTTTVTTTVTTASDADRLCPRSTATVTACEFVGRVLQWLRSHDAMLASLSAGAR